MIFHGVDVSFDYKISLSVNEDSSVKDLIVTSYKVDEEQPVDITSMSESIEGHINYSDQIKSRIIRIYIKWDDSENATMDNAQDTRHNIC